VWRDAANTDANLIPSRALHAVGARVGPFRGLTFSVELRNLGDLRVVDQPLGGSIHAGQTTAAPLVDVYGYPLPGRAIYATLTLAK
jgi:outer membrane receptor protein involved in Fe transport